MLLTVTGIALALSSDLVMSQKLQAILLSPFISIVGWYFFLCCILMCEYLGPFGKILARALVLYFYVFSRLVVQRPPRVELSLTRK
jgi:hypothetical protein